ncbi:MAG TPA: hypothetical protein VNT23_01495, partial [Gaiellaceae bacterium]|nr:hypothetical protein [Gaiellaceae bacterium]
MDARAARVVGAAALAGLALALGVTLLLPETFRADATLVLAREGRAPGDDPSLAPAAEAAAGLLESRAVAESAVANLRLEETAEELLDRVGVEHEPGTSLLRLRVDAGDREEARRAAQELAEVFAVLYNTRFGPETTVSIWEAPRARAAPVAPRRGLNAALGLLTGALAGVVWGTLRRRPRAEPAHEPLPRAAASPAPAPDPDAPVEERVAALTERELALARRAAELAVRERELEEARAAVPATQPPELVTTSEPEPEAEPEPQPVEPESQPVEPEPAATTAFVEPAFGEWTVRDVELLLEQEGPAFP